MGENLQKSIAQQFDVKNRKILAELDANARQTTSEIAKKVGISSQLTGHRITGLIENKTIGRFLTIFNFRKLGYDAYYVLVELQHVTKEKEEEIISFIGKQPSCVWLVSLYGRHALLFTILAKSAADFRRAQAVILEKFAPVIKQSSFVIGLEGSHGRKKYFVASDSIEKNPMIESSQIFHPDAKDLQIMNRLYLNPLESLTEIARNIGCNFKTVRTRMKKLVDEKVVLKTTFELNSAKVKYEWHLMFLEFNHSNVSSEKKLKAYLYAHPNVVYVTSTVGRWNLLVDFHVMDHDELDRVLHELRERFGGLIKSYENVRISRTHKCSFLPEKLFRE